MHILLIHQAFASDSQAGGTRHFELARHLVEHGHRVTVVAGSRSYMTGEMSTVESSDPGIRILWPRARGGNTSSFAGRIVSFASFMLSSAVAALRVGKVDVVWGTSPPIFQAVSAYVVSRLKNQPFVLEVRDLWPDFAVEMQVLRSPTLIRLSRALEMFLYRRADRLIINSPGFASHIARVAGPTRRKAILVPNGVDLESFDQNGHDSLSGFDWINDSSFIALYAGAHGPANGLDIVLSAAGILRKDSEILFVLVGDGRDKARLEGEASRLGLSNVIFVPAQPKANIPQLLKAADVCLATLKPLALFATTYPNKVFDYMAAGRPTVLAIDGVIRNVIESASAGTFVPPGNAQALARAILHYRDHPEIADLHGKNARRCVETEFSRRQHGAVIATVFDEVTGTHV